MNIVLDIETNGLINPDKIWLIVCKDIDTGEYHLFKNVTENTSELERFTTLLERVVRSSGQIIGHNILGFDIDVLVSALKLHSEVLYPLCVDTLILSRLIDYPREGHSVEDYGVEFGSSKGNFYKFNDPSLHNPNSELFKELEDYCIRDVDIAHKIYLKFYKYILKEEHKSSIELEHKFQLIVNDLHTNGFKFNIKRAKELLDKVNLELVKLDLEIDKSFPPKLTLVREIHPKVTKHGTLSKSDFRWHKDGDLSIYNGGPFCLCRWSNFNPSSHKQLVQILTDAGWVPVDKTTTHIRLEQEINRHKYNSRGTKEVDLRDKYVKLKLMEKSGWKINETNLATLPDTAPASTRTLARRILLEARRRTLTEWLGLVKEDGRIHGEFLGIGAWTHRMAHQKPNTANIPNEFNTEGKVRLLGKEMRGLWQAPKNRLLVGVDAEGIQLRIFAHYIDDAEFTKALVEGDKKDGTDPHSLNQRILGSACQTRAAAKRFIYALLLGAGLPKLAEILATSKDEANRALERLLERYQGFATLKATHIPADAKRGWFVGIDGRKVAIPGETVGQRKHLCMSGYLQNGEAIVMKAATIEWYNRLNVLRKEHPDLNYLLVNFVHDEWQTEVNNNMDLALLVAKTQADSLTYVGEKYKLKCPLAGSYWSDDREDYTIGTKWSQTH